MPLIIAHRGASGYLPEHTLEAKALAYGLGADFLEQDVVATRDDELVVLHDTQLDAVTDVASRFADRKRADGHYYVRDFDLAELQMLNVHERRIAGSVAAVFPGRFPTADGRFRIPSLREELMMIRGLNKSTGRQVGIYPEIKRPGWHRREGVDVGRLMLEILAEFDLWRATDRVYLQCFDPGELRRLRHEQGSELRLVQLIGQDGEPDPATDYAAMITESGLREIARTVDAIGPGLERLYASTGTPARPEPTDLVKRAHDAGLAVHPYTFRADALPGGFTTFAETVQWFVQVAGVDGLFTDFPDLARAALQPEER